MYCDFSLEIRFHGNYRSTSYGVYISLLIRFTRAPSYITEFNTRN